VRGRVPDNRKRNRAVGTSTTAGPTTDMADEANLPNRTTVLTCVVVTPVEPETKARPRATAMTTLTVVMKTGVEDRVGDRVIPDAKKIHPQVMVTGLTTTVHRRMMTA